jgi:flagellar hook protein FlgE
MGIFDALTTAVTGMRAQAYALQNISGNIANSQTTAFKRIDTSFEDMIPDAVASQQLAGSVVAHSSSTNSVQGDIHSASVSTYMAINGQGFFVVQKPESFVDNNPSFGGVDLYSRRGDFQVDQSGYLVNGAGYYLMGIPIDSTTGNLSGSVPQILQFQNGFLPAQATTEIGYHANLASYPLTADHNTAILGSELLNQANFSANPVVGATVAAKITGNGAVLSPDAAAVVTGSLSIASLSSAGGTLGINATSIAIAASDDAAAVQAKINAQTATTGVTASLDASNQLVLTSADAKTNITIGGASTLSLLNELGLSANTTNATNLFTQSAASAGQTLTLTVGANAPLTLTFGSGAGLISTLADLNAALSGLSGGIASADPLTGNITTALPSNGTVAASDVTTFLNESIAGGAITTYDTSGSAVNVQLRWAKTDSSTLGVGHADTWNLFYQTNANATGTEAAWKNAGVNYSFGANGQLDPAVNSVALSNVTVGGIALGDIQLSHGSGGITQFADSNGNAQVNLLQQNGFPAGQLESVAVSDKGRVVGTYSNGRTIDLAEITLANFSGANMLKRIDGGAFEATAESGAPTYNAPARSSAHRSRAPTPTSPTSSPN